MINKEEKLELFMSLKEYLEKLINGAAYIIDLYRQGEETKANQFIADAFEGLDWTVQAMLLTHEIHNINVDLEALNGHLNEMKNAFENSDFILLSDILEYEIVPILVEWSEAIFSKEFGVN